VAARGSTACGDADDHARGASRRRCLGGPWGTCITGFCNVHQPTDLLSVDLCRIGCARPGRANRVSRRQEGAEGSGMGMAGVHAC
jgi:hypothetical protein